MNRFRFETKKATERAVEYMTFEAKEWKADPQDENILEGYAAAFGNVDDGRDMIVAGAFLKTIAERVPAGKVKLTDSHDWSSRGTIGTIIAAKKDEYGLWVRAKFSSDPDAQRIKTKILEGHLKYFSIGYETIAFEYLAVDNVQVRVLKELKLREVSVTPFPMNEGAIITAVKGLEALTADMTKKEGRVLSARNAENIREVLQALGKLRASLQGLLDAAEPPEKASPNGGAQALPGTHREEPPLDELGALHIKAARNRLRLLTLKGDER